MHGSGYAKGNFLFGTSDGRQQSEFRCRRLDVEMSSSSSSFSLSSPSSSSSSEPELETAYLRSMVNVSELGLVTGVLIELLILPPLLLTSDWCVKFCLVLTTRWRMPLTDTEENKTPSTCYAAEDTSSYCKTSDVVVIVSVSLCLMLRLIRSDRIARRSSPRSDGQTIGAVPVLDAEWNQIIITIISLHFSNIISITFIYFFMAKSKKSSSNCTVSKNRAWQASLSASLIVSTSLSSRDRRYSITLAK